MDAARARSAVSTNQLGLSERIARALYDEAVDEVTAERVALDPSTARAAAIERAHDLRRTFAKQAGDRGLSPRERQGAAGS